MNPATESSERDAHGSGLPADVTVAMVQAELEKILASPGFANADRLSRFLRYSVSEFLNGQADRLKESLLGVEVFGRKPTYDPRIDAVVRTEAVKLRARLKEYYENDGANDDLIIDLPKGGYVPAFRLRERALAVATPVAPAVIAEEAVPAAMTVVLPPESERLWLRYGLAVAFILAVFLGAIFLTARGRGVRAHGPGENSIAVLPFADLSPERNQEYFCDGMTDEVIDSLTKVSGFRVVARTSSFAFKGQQQDVREIGKKLNVGYVLEGSVRKDGNRLRVTAQLNSVKDGYHLWSETYERELKDVFAVQDDISRSIVNTLQVRLASSSRLARPAPGNLATYDLYLQGRYHWGRWRSEGAERAIQYFQEAIAKDPNYAPAYAGVADSYTWLGFYSALPPSEAMPKARQFADKALSLDGSLADAHLSLGFVKALYDFDWDGAEAEFKRAIELNPNSAVAHFGYGVAYLCPTGHVEQGVSELKIAKELDPLSLIMNTYYGLTLFLDNQPKAAIEQYKHALELDPNFSEARLSLATAYSAMHDYADANAQLDKISDGVPQSRVDLERALIAAAQGQKQKALELTQKWENPPKDTVVHASSIANVYATLGDRENALRWIQRALDDRDGMLVYSAHNFPWYHTDPRFEAKFKKIGLN